MRNTGDSTAIFKKKRLSFYKKFKISSIKSVNISIHKEWF